MAIETSATDETFNAAPAVEASCPGPRPAFRCQGRLSGRLNASAYYLRRVSGAVLVGGASRRMGRPKSLLTFDGRSFLTRTLDLLRPFVHRRVVIGKTNAPDAPRIIREANRSGVAWLDDRPRVVGPLAGIAAALASDVCSRWMVLPCDMPDLSPDAVEWLLAEHDDSDAATVGIFSTCRAPEPFPMVLSPGAGASLSAFIETGGTSLRDALDFIHARKVLIPRGMERFWMNVNTEEDFRSCMIDGTAVT